MEKQDQDNRMKMCPPYSIHTIRQMLFKNYLYFFIRDIVFFFNPDCTKIVREVKVFTGRGGVLSIPSYESLLQGAEGQEGVGCSDFL